jgi:hypothetical protein
MTLRKAIQILITRAASDMRGGGLGYHTIPTGQRYDEAIEAMKIAWKYAYKCEITQNDKFNLGIW